MLGGGQAPPELDELVSVEEAAPPEPEALEVVAPEAVVISGHGKHCTVPQRGELIPNVPEDGEEVDEDEDEDEDAPPLPLGALSSTFVDAQPSVPIHAAGRAMTAALANLVVS